MISVSLAIFGQLVWWGVELCRMVTDKIQNDGFNRIFQLNSWTNVVKYTKKSVNDEFMQTQDSITDTIGYISSIFWYSTMWNDPR